MVTPVVWVTNAMLVNQRDGYAEMGIYNAANQWRNLILFVPAILAQVNLPIMTERTSRKEYGASWAHVKLALYANMLLTGPVTALLCLLSPIIAGLYGEEFRRAWPVFAVALGSAFLQAIQSPIVTLWSAKNQMWKNFLMNLAWAALVICLSWLWIESLALGLMMALLVSFIFYGVAIVMVEVRWITREVASEN
jgi:O-antigen/teichoic acid export membrane protein